MNWHVTKYTKSALKQRLFIMKLAPEEVSPIYSIRFQQLLLVTQSQRVGRGVGVK